MSFSRFSFLHMIVSQRVGHAWIAFLTVLRPNIHTSLQRSRMTGVSRLFSFANDFVSERKLVAVSPQVWLFVRQVAVVDGAISSSDSTSSKTTPLVFAAIFCTRFTITVFNSQCDHRNPSKPLRESCNQFYYLKLKGLAFTDVANGASRSCSTATIYWAICFDTCVDLLRTQLQPK
jgi:hypothetical protein